MKTLVIRESADGQQTLQETTFPPVVYVPLAEPPDRDELTVDLRQMQDGRLALLVYSALDRLVDCCGEEQPWAVMPSAKLDTLQQGTGFEAIFLDLKIPEERRRHVLTGEQG